jgi:hypothetical protein
MAFRNGMRGPPFGEPRVISGWLELFHSSQPDEIARPKLGGKQAFRIWQKMLGR